MNILPILNNTPTITKNGHHVIINNSHRMPTRRHDGTRIQAGDYHIDTYLGDDALVWECTSEQKNGILGWSDINTPTGLNLTPVNYVDLINSLTQQHPTIRALLIKKGRRRP